VIDLSKAFQKAKTEKPLTTKLRAFAPEVGFFRTNSSENYERLET
jgi:hypothetical protein